MCSATEPRTDADASLVLQTRVPALHFNTVPLCRQRKPLARYALLHAQTATPKWANTCQCNGSWGLHLQGPLHRPPEPASCRRRHACMFKHLKLSGTVERAIASKSWQEMFALCDRFVKQFVHFSCPKHVEQCQHIRDMILRKTYSFESSSISSFFCAPVGGYAIFNCEHRWIHLSTKLFNAGSNESPSGRDVLVCDRCTALAATPFSHIKGSTISGVSINFS